MRASRRTCRCHVNLGPSHTPKTGIWHSTCAPNLNTWTPPRQDLVRSKGDHRYSCWQRCHRAGLVQGLTWCGCRVPLCFELWDKSICGFAFSANTASAPLEIPPHQIAAKLRNYTKFHPSQTGQRFKSSWIVESFRIMSSLFGMIYSLTLSSPMSHHFLGAFLDLLNNQLIILLMSSLHIPKCFPSIPSIFL